MEVLSATEWPAYLTCHRIIENHAAREGLHWQDLALVMACLTGHVVGKIWEQGRLPGEAVDHTLASWLLETTARPFVPLVDEDWASWTTGEAEATEQPHPTCPGAAPLWLALGAILGEYNTEGLLNGWQALRIVLRLTVDVWGARFPFLADGDSEDRQHMLPVLCGNWRVYIKHRHA